MFKQETSNLLTNLDSSTDTKKLHDFCTFLERLANEKITLKKNASYGFREK